MRLALVHLNGGEMEENSQVIRIADISQGILFLRGQKVMLDADLARIYGVPTKRLNEQVKRNRTRFPEDFMFQLTETEKVEVVAICDHLKMTKFSNVLPYAFTEHGAVMLASVLNSEIAVQASVQVVRAFIRLREILMTHKDLARKIDQLEKKYDSKFKIVFDAIRQLMTPPSISKRRIGF
jgi:hypothetical protein